MIDDEWKELGSVQAESGCLQLAVPERRVISITASPFVAKPQDYTEVEGSRVSKYFQLTRTVLVDKDNISVDFALPSAAAMLLDAYSPEGEKMLMRDFNAQVTPDHWYQQVYGVFPLETASVPTSASVGQLSGAWRADRDYDQWQPYFAIPPGEPVYLTMLWRVPSLGTIWVRADHEGKGYRLQQGEVQRKNLVYEFAKTEYARAKEMAKDWESQGYRFSPEVYAQLDAAGDSLNQASTQADERSRALSSYKVLQLSIGAKESMTLEAAERGIEGRKKTISIAIMNDEGGPVPEANVAYEQTSLEFVKGYGIQGLTEPPAPSTVAGRDMGFEYLYKGDLSWREVEAERGVYDFSGIDSYLEKAGSLGYEVVVGMLWLGGGSDGVSTWASVPDWAKGLELQEFKQELRQFARKTAEHLGGRIGYLLPAVEPELFTRMGSRYVGADFTTDYATTVQVGELIELIKAVFQGARDANGGARLGYSMSPIYNYYHVNPVPFGSPPAPYYLLKLALERGVEADFIGVEGNYGTMQAPVDLAMLRMIVEDVHRLSNLPILLTEVSSYPSRTEDYKMPSNIYWHEGMTQEAQAQWNTGVFKIAMGLPYVLGAQMVHSVPDNPPEWGAKVNGGTFIGTDFLTQDSRPKRTYGAVKALFDSWNARGNTVTDGQGRLSFDGFGGSYELAITTTDGRHSTRRVHIDEGRGSPIDLTVGMDSLQKPGD